MQHRTLSAQLRQATGKGANRRLRASGFIPAVVYGGGRPATPLTVSPKEAVAILHGTYGRNTIIDLAVEGEAAPRMVIIKDLLVHPWRRTLRHLDFWEITPETRLTLDVPFRRVGRSPAEKAGGKAEQTSAEIRVSCLPAAVPPFIEYDMGTLAEGKSVLAISEVPLPQGVEPAYNNDFSIIQVKVPKIEEVDEEGEEGEAEAAVVAEA